MEIINHFYRAAYQQDVFEPAAQIRERKVSYFEKVNRTQSRAISRVEIVGAFA